MRSAILTGILALALPFASAQTSTWVSDSAHSEVDFSVTHLTIANVHGRFGKVAATLLYDQADPARSTVKTTIDVSTVDTGEPGRDTDLKSARFFDTAQFQTASFESTSVARDGDGLAVSGNLTLHGITRPVVLKVEGPTGPVEGMDHKQHSGFSATTTISRSAFGIGANVPPTIVGDAIKLSIDLDVAKQ
jgi:polyisoprenoid-binding protein YceI